MNGSPPLWRSIRRLSVAALIAALCFPAIAVRADDGRMSMAEQGRELPRGVLGLFDSRREPNPEESRIHRLLDMPLNHLGLVVRYHDIAKGLPDPASLTGVRGVVTFFDGPVPDSQAYAQWASDVLDRDIRYVIMGDPGLVVDDGPERHLARQPQWTSWAVWVCGPKTGMSRIHIASGCSTRRRG